MLLALRTLRVEQISLDMGQDSVWVLVFLIQFGMLVLRGFHSSPSAIFGLTAIR